MIKPKGKRRRVRIVLLTFITFFCLCMISILYFQPKIFIRWLAARSPEVLYFVTTTDKVVALTIDDSPHETVTPQILDVLKENSANATFFVIGDRAKGKEALLERIRKEGHEIGNHMAKDRASILLSPSEFEEQLLEVDRVLALTGPIKWFRPGSGWYNQRMLDQLRIHGYRCALGSVYPYDTIVRNTALISRYVVNQVYPGSIIVIHEGTPDRIRSVDVLRRILPVLKDKGYKVVTLSDLVGNTYASTT